MTANPIGAKRHLKDPNHLPFVAVLAQEYNTVARHEGRNDLFSLKWIRDIGLKAHMDQRTTRRTILERLKLEKEVFGKWNEVVMGQRVSRNALCFSGGGIRSACFNLGFLRALLEGDQAIFPKFQYLSTVSGGGYIGSWFSAWLHRERQKVRKDTTTAKTPKDLTEQALKAITGKMRQQNSASDLEADEVRYLRKYGSYMMSELSPFSIDTWTVFATYLRNIILNWALFIPLLLASVALPNVIFDDWLKPLIESKPAGSLTFDTCVAGVVLCTLTASVYGMFALPASSNSQRGWGPFALFRLLPQLFAGFCFLCGFCSAVNDPSPDKNFDQWTLLGALLGPPWILLLVVSPLSLLKEKKYAVYSIRAIVWSVLVTLLAQGFYYCYLEKFWEWLADQLWQIHAEGDDFRDRIIVVIIPYLASLALVVQNGLLVGTLSRVSDNEDREWWARATAWLLSISTGIFAFIALALLGNDLVTQLFPEHWSPWVKAITGTLALLTGLQAALLGKSAVTVFNDKSLNILRRPDVYAGVFVLLLLLASCLFCSSSLGQPPDGQWNQFLYFVRLLAFPFVGAAFININEFSLHFLYRNRLIRTFLGAIHRRHDDPKVNRFIGLSPSDNISFSRLREQLPIQIVNMTLNIQQDTNLATKERRGQSFTASPLHVGNPTLGYRPTRTYTEDGLTLGTAMAVSGAAFSPSMGYYSKPVVSMVMALFNTRLGWWVGNPRFRKACRKNGPGYALLPALCELLSLTNEKRGFINLSDGGHFDNLGLYEMIRRRCRYIVVVDVGADQKYRASEFAMIVRKARIDMGAEIDLNKDHSFTDAKGKVKGFYVEGTIKYSRWAEEPQETGRLLYIKPAVIAGKEGIPFDVSERKLSDANFPHDPTFDQLYTETKFEAYRALGYFLGKEIQKLAPDFFTEMVSVDSSKEEFAQKQNSCDGATTYVAQSEH